MNTKKTTPVHVTTGGGKMKGIPSVNTSSLKNKFCQAMSKVKGSICSSCYSNRYSKFRTSLEKRLIQNSELLSSRLLTDQEIPMFNSLFVRFNSFGEIINNTHYLNLMAIAKKNPQSTFGLWTKKYAIVMKYEKVDNIKYIYSLSEVDGESPSVKIRNWFDKVFMVQSKKDERINCYQSCIDCLLCYTDNDVKVIREKKK